jgi:AcrR family transcriptional regulator
MAVLSPTDLRPPLQERSRRTLRRILDALEVLLAEKSFENITVQQVVGKAKVSVGSFYARFPTKETLLPALYERWDREIRSRSFSPHDLEEARSQTLEQLAERLVSTVVKRQRSRRWFMRSVALHARQHPELITPLQRARRTELHRHWAQLFLLHRPRMQHPDPEQAVALAIFTVVTTAREKIVFSDAPHASSFRLSDRRLIEELTRMFLAYLGVVPGKSRLRRRSAKGSKS